MAAGFSADGVAQLLERVQLQDELIVGLRQENGVLAEMVKQKDTRIAQLARELQNRGTKTDHCNKTEFTSRESDDHHRDRQTVILRQKNQKLKRLVHKKQQTIAHLMQTLQSALGGQTSDGDMLKTEDDEEGADSDAAVDALPTGHFSIHTPQAAAAAPSDGSSSSEPEAVRKEVRAVTSATTLAAVSQPAVPSPSAASPPPPRSPPAQQQAQGVAPSRGMAGFDFSAVGGAPPCVGGGRMSEASEAALKALARETELLEEKKRVVEQLAKQLEPPSDNEDTQ